MDRMPDAYSTSISSALPTPSMRYFRALAAVAIVNLTSIGGIVGYTGVGYYCATKFAVEGLSDTLRAEIAPLGEAFRRKSRHRNGAGTARKVALSGAKE
jgi:hypothetical protein